MQELRKHSWLVLALVVCGVACAARSGMLALHGNQLHEDRDGYVDIGRHLAREGTFARDYPPGVTAYRPPLFPLLIAAVIWCHGYSFTLGVVHVVLGTLTVGLTFRVGYLLNLRLASAIAAGLVALDPLLLQSTVLAMTETLCAMLVILWCWVLLEFPACAETERVACAIPKMPSTSPWWPPLLHGACFGLICLCRPGFLATIGLAGVWVLAPAILNGRAVATREKLRCHGSAAVWTLIGLAVVLTPWVVRNGMVIGKATPATTHGGYTLLLANNPVFYHEVVLQPWGTVWQGDSLNRWQTKLEMQMAIAGIQSTDEVSRDRWMYRQAWSHIRAEPILFCRACLWRGIRFWDLAPWRVPTGYTRFLLWGTALFYGLVTCGMCIALARLTAVEWKTWSVLLLLPLTLWLTHLVYWTDMRMRAPVIPILALLAARGVRSLAQGTQRNRQATP